MKFGPLIEYSMRNVFLEKSYTKWDGEARPRPFVKYKFDHIFGSTVRNVIKFVFIVCPSRGPPIISKQRCRPFAFTLYKAFLKNKKRSGTSLLVSFSA